MNLEKAKEEDESSSEDEEDKNDKFNVWLRDEFDWEMTGASGILLNKMKELEFTKEEFKKYLKDTMTYTNLENFKIFIKRLESSSDKIDKFKFWLKNEFDEEMMGEKEVINKMKELEFTEEDLYNCFKIENPEKLTSLMKMLYGN
jgi:hypothetical protein